MKVRLGRTKPSPKMPPAGQATSQKAREVAHPHLFSVTVKKTNRVILPRTGGSYAADTSLVVRLCGHFLCRSVDRRQANFGEQLHECRIAVKADETLVIAKIQHDLVMRLDANGKVLERFARVAEPSVSLRHKIG